MRPRWRRRRESVSRWLTFFFRQEFIRKQFLDLPADKSKSIYCHWTCAINTQNVEVVFRVVKETLLREILQNFVP